MHMALRRLPSSQIFRFFSRSMSQQKPVAIVLSGCGVYDGSEVHEASAVMVHLSRHGKEYKIFAPDINQMHVINHCKGEEMAESRNVLVESARIARGAISPLSDLKADDHSAVILPGGFGAAKNLSNFAVKGAELEVTEEVTNVLNSFHGDKKPIGLCCIAPVIAAKVFKGCSVTLGQDDGQDGRWPYAGATGAVTANGSVHVCKEVNEVHIDETNKIVTTPAYMCETKVHEIHDGVGEMVKEILKMI